MLHQDRERKVVEEAVPAEAAEGQGEEEQEEEAVVAVEEKLL